MSITSHTPTASPTPLCLEPLFYEKVWGGDRLARFSDRVKPNDKVGEAWLLADMASTSASGAGGGSARTLITQGPLKGKTLRDAIALFGHALLGHQRPHSHGGVGEFPLLVKLLDATENLSVQVHPSPAYAAHHPGAHLKTECWYILDAKPDSVIYKGLRPGVTRGQLETALRTGDARGIVELMGQVPARAGDCHNLPSGTLHALGAGVLVAEVQTPSDTTFRVYDWGRQGRALHVDQALQCIDLLPAPAATRLEPHARAARLVTTEFFALDEYHLPGDQSVSLGDTHRCCVIIPLSPGATLAPSTGQFDPVELKPGVAVLIPASISAGAIVAAAGEARFLLASLPV